MFDRWYAADLMEVKWKEHPSHAGARHLMKFLDEHGDRVGKGYIIYRVKEPMEINERVTALPWFCL